MSTFTLGGDRSVLLTHMAFHGLASILVDAGIDDLTLTWHEARPVLAAPGLDDAAVGGAVLRHAAAHSGGSWVARDATIDGTVRGLMSSRLSVFKTSETWSAVQEKRHDELDGLTAARAWLDLHMLAALGEPCYWSRNRKGDRLQDHGASRLEMQPRNRGSEIVTNRLRPLAANVAARTAAAVVAGLDGTDPVDEMGNGATPTGLAVPGLVDNALAWCALWGISTRPIAPVVNAAAVTTGHLGRSHDEWFYAPVWNTPWRPARLRSVLASAQLRIAAGAGLQHWSQGQGSELTAGAWLRTRGVIGVVRFPIGRFGSDNAPERRALHGENVALGGAR